MKIIHRNDSLHTPGSRDAALRRLTRANRWLIGGSVALTGVLTDIAANAFSGRTIHSSSTGEQTRAHTKHKPLAPPAQTPKPAAPAQEPAPQSSAPAESPPAETPTNSESAPAPSSQAPAPAEETPKPEVHEAPPRSEEPSEPVVSGGS